MELYQDIPKLFPEIGSCTAYGLKMQYLEMGMGRNRGREPGTCLAEGLLDLHSYKY